MASVDRPGKSWRVRFREGGRRGDPVRSEHFATKALAVRFAGLVDAAGQQYPKGWVPRRGFIEPQEKVGPTLAEWFERALAANVRANPATKDDYRRLFAKHVPSWLAERPVEAITREDAGKWVAHLAATRYGDRPISEKTVKNVHGMLSSAMSAASYDGLVGRNVFVGLLAQRPSVDAEEQVFLTSDEFEAILARAPDHPDSVDLLRLLFHTGLRIGEATVLRPSDIELSGDNARLRVVRAWKRGDFMGLPKTSRSRRWVALGPAMVEMLRPRVERGHSLLFQNTQAGQLMQASVRVYTWNPAVASALESGALTKRPRIHDLRHSHAAYLLSHNVPLLAVSRRLGHSSIQVTADRYGHLLPAVDEGIRDLL